jgi:hypothetical protein
MTSSAFVRTFAGAIGLWFGAIACCTAAGSGSLQIVKGHFAFTFNGKEYPSARAACAAYMASFTAPERFKNVRESDDYGDFVCAIDAGFAYTLQCPPHSTARHLADVPKHSSDQCVCASGLVARNATTCAPRDGTTEQAGGSVGLTQSNKPGARRVPR